MILVTGGTGLVGTALKKYIPDGFFLSSKDCDLTSYEETRLIFTKYNPEYVIHLAAKVGGVKANIERAGEFYRDNILINTNVLECARVSKVKKLVSILSTCIYPANVSYPYTEDQIHSGPPFDDHFGYAYAKRMMDIQSRAYRKQWDCNFVTVVSNNLFGEHDNFDLDNGHVLPSLIRKIYEGKKFNTPVTVWGNGASYREFTYAEDFAKALLLVLEKYNDKLPLNIGNTEEYSISTIVEKLCTIFNYSGTINYTFNLLGQHRKPSSNKRLFDLGWKKDDYSNFDKTLTKTCTWFSENYPNLRGI
jgi:GDP-L-fucose synthase